MRIAFFHGLESPHRSEKNDLLEATFEHVYAPPMDYTDPKLFEQVLREVKDQQIDLLIGSSMGGWFAYCISTLTGIPTLLFNPAVQGRSIEPAVRRRPDLSVHTLVLGKTDDIINPQKTIEWLKANEAGLVELNWEFHGHRIPIESFTKWVKHMAETFDK
jgi:hypothetical protein